MHFRFSKNTQAIFFSRTIFLEQSAMDYNYLRAEELEWGLTKKCAFLNSSWNFSASTTLGTEAQSLYCQYASKMIPKHMH